MSRLSDLTASEWLGFAGLIFFGGVLIWSLTVGFKSKPPGDRPK